MATPFTSKPDRASARCGKLAHQALPTEAFIAESTA
jgi:hypothetical protein